MKNDVKITKSGEDCEGLIYCLEICGRKSEHSFYEELAEAIAEHFGISKSMPSFNFFVAYVDATCDILAEEEVAPKNVYEAVTLENIGETSNRENSIRRMYWDLGK